ncbi:MAG: hypothetical protein HC792_00290 [Acaryochloridaceae cyanobacterium CSU_5_19]|nr:hypothetical protein [Acaryochloridaceae cyanobacterium CSU_5_19]
MQSLLSKQDQYQQLQQQLAQGQDRRQEIDRSIQSLQALAEKVAQLPHLERQCQQIQDQRSRIEAAQQFETELQQLINQIAPEQDQYSSKWKLP